MYCNLELYQLYLALIISANMHSFKLTSLTLSKEITEGKLSLEYASDELSENPW